MSVSAEYELLFELSLAIGDSTELEPMLRRFLVELRRLFNVTGGAIFQVQQLVQESESSPHLVCTVPETLARNPSYIEFWGQWSAIHLYESLARRPDELPLITEYEDGALHALRLPGFGLLVFLTGRSAGVLSNRMQHAFVALARKLANAANACLHRSRMRRQTQRLELARESAGIGVWEWNPESGRLDWDIQMRHLFGVTNESFTGTFADWQARIHPADLDQTLKTLNRLAKGADQGEFEFRILREDSGIRHLRGQAVLIRSQTSGALRMVGVCMDISSSKRIQSALDQARDMAERANRGKSQFISAMGTRIRDPMLTILETAALTLDTELTPTQRNYVSRLTESGEILIEFLDDLLDFARLDAGELKTQSIVFNLATMVAESLEPLAAKAEKKGLSFVGDLPEEIAHYHVGDPGRIRHVLTNVCSTAIDLTETGEIRVQLRSRPNPAAQNDDIQIAVITNGLDIQCNDLRQLLDALKPTRTQSIPAHAVDAEFGLTMATRLIEHLGGHLWLDAKSGRSKVFFINLGLPRAEAPDIPKPAHQDWKGKRALIVDDNALNRRTLAYWLGQWGFTTRQMSDAQLTLQHLREAKPSYDVILLDAFLPGMDAYRLTHKLREERLLDRAQIVLISPGATRGEAQRCREAGIRAFLTKPTPADQIRDVLTRLLDPNATQSNQRFLTRHDIKEQRPRLRILLIENKELDRKLTASLLVQWGHFLTSVKDAKPAIDQFAPHAFDLVMIDMHLPEMDGTETARGIRKKEAGMNRLPIIGMSANLEESDRLSCLEAGMDELIAKPIQADTLKELIARLTYDNQTGRRNRKP